MNEPCPVCGTPAAKTTSREDADYVDCPRCGAFALTGTARAVLSSIRDLKASARISHSIFKMARSGPWPKIGSDLVMSLRDSPSASPTPSEQLDNLVLWLGETQEDPGRRIDASPRAIAAAGAVDFGGLGFVVGEGIAQALIHSDVRWKTGLGVGSRECIILPMQLSMKGWHYFETLKRAQASSRVAFMAMPFGHDDLDKIYRECFQPAVSSTGFTLKRLDERQPAGLIDDRLRVEIRQSRFLLSDLTHKNPGAYWEAGYAEGLGRPVIYTCRRDVFDEEKQRPHFDTNHHLTVQWDPARMPEAMEKLKNTIRATLPDEAKLSDSSNSR